MASKKRRRLHAAHQSAILDELEPPNYRHLREALGIQEFIAPLRQAPSPHACEQELLKLSRRRSHFERDIQVKRQKLLELLSSEGAADILALASLSYIYRDPNIVKESENDRSPAHLEYLGLQALSVGLEPAIAKPPPAEFAHITFRALRLVRHIFGRKHLLVEIDAFASVSSGVDRAAVEYQRNTQLNSMNVRISSFPHYIRRVTEKCFEPFDDRCREVLGFTAKDAIAVSESLVESRLLPNMELLQELVDTRNDLQRQYNRLRDGDRRIPFPAWTLRLPHYDTQLAIDLLAWSEFESLELASFTSTEMAEAASVPIPAASSVLSKFCASDRDFEEKHHAFPVGAHPLTTKPILSYATRFLMPAPQMLLEAIRPRMEALLHDPKSPLWQQYTKHRGKYLERESIELLGSALVGSSSWRSVSWRSPTAAGEIDGLVHLGDVCLQIQCKSGKITAAARRGSDSHMATDVDKLISRATEQHQALMNETTTTPLKELGLSPSQTEALQSPLQFQVIVTLDDLVVWATLASRLKTIGQLPAGQEIPWVLSLTDLMVVVDMLKNAELVDYLVRRQRLERDGRVIAHDEQDWLGHYITDALCFGTLPEHASHERPVLLPSQSEQFDAWISYDAGRRDAPTKQPRQYLPTNLRELIDRLQLERPDHWVIATVVLLDGDRTSRTKLSQQIMETTSHLQSKQCHSVDRTLNEVGLTYYVNHQIPTEIMRDEARKHGLERATENGVDLWVVIGEASELKLSVIIHNNDPLDAAVDKLLEPRTPASD